VVAEGYRRFVDPSHRLLDALFPGSPPAGDGETAERLEAVLASAREQIDYDPAPGRREFDHLLAEASGGGRVRLNCIDAACVLVSHLRRLGFSERNVYVAIGGRSNRLQVSLGVDFHAWVLVLLADGPRWVEPATLRAKSLSAEEIFAEHRIYALFNDRDARFLEAHKRRLFEAAAADPDPRLYAFGRADSVTRAALEDAEFRSLVAELLRSPTVPAAEVRASHPDRLRAWESRQLLVERDGRLQAGPRLVLVPRAPAEELAAALGGLMDRYLGLIAASLSGLRAAVEAAEVGRLWGWDRVSHVVVLGLLADLAVGRAVDVEGMAGGGGATVWGFAGALTRHAVGVVWAESPDRRWALGQLWHRQLARRPVRVSGEMVEQLGRVVLGRSIEGSAESLLLRHAGLLRRRGAEWEPRLPVFRPGEATILSERLAAAAGRAVREVIEPALACAGGLLWWRSSAARGALSAPVVRLVLDQITERVFDAGLVAPLEAIAEDRAWGRWLWLGEVGDALPRSQGAGAAAPMEAVATR
jgi:Transglutaminase-like superfamily